MRIGKLTNEQLKSLVFSRLKNNREILLRSGVGEDCAALRFGDEACVLSTDPVTGATKNIGEIAVHISCNDVASSGAEPEAMLVTLLIPPESTAEEVEKVMDELISTANSLSVDIIGGHTEVTDAVNRIVVSGTVIGRVKAKRLITSGGAKPGDFIIMTGYAAMEGTYIIASEYEERIAGLIDTDDREALSHIKSNMSVANHGITAGKAGATAMHDVTEGGILGAVYELCEASGTGCEIYKENIPVLPVTKKICSLFGISAYKLIGSGSMLITSSNGENMVKVLSGSSIVATIIGRITEKDKVIFDNGSAAIIEPPEADELFFIK